MEAHSHWTIIIIIVMASRLMRDDVTECQIIVLREQLVVFRYSDSEFAHASKCAQRGKRVSTTMLSDQWDEVVKIRHDMTQRESEERSSAGFFMRKSLCYSIEMSWANGTTRLRLCLFHHCYLLGQRRVQETNGNIAIENSFMRLVRSVFQHEKRLWMLLLACCRRHFQIPIEMMCIFIRSFVRSSSSSSLSFRQLHHFKSSPHWISPYHLIISFVSPFEWNIYAYRTRTPCHSCVGEKWNGLVDWVVYLQQATGFAELNGSNYYVRATVHWFVYSQGSENSGETCARHFGVRPLHYGRSEPKTQPTISHISISTILITWKSIFNISLLCACWSETKRKPMMAIAAAEGTM